MPNDVRDRVMKGHRSIQPEIFKDPLAEKTEWRQTRSGGANFSTHKLVSNREYRLEFHATIQAKLFYFSFLAMGVGALYNLVLPDLLAEEILLTKGFTISLLACSIFSILGVCLMLFFTQPVVFDKQRKEFWKGRASTSKPLHQQILKFFGGLDDIHALQLLSKRRNGGKGSNYNSHELNLVLTDGCRVNIVDHGNITQIRQEAKTLSKFLGIPIWDAA